MTLNCNTGQRILQTHFNVSLGRRGGGGETTASRLGHDRWLDLISRPFYIIKRFTNYTGLARRQHLAVEIFQFRTKVFAISAKRCPKFFSMAPPRSCYIVVPIGEQLKHRVEKMRIFIKWTMFLVHRPPPPPFNDLSPGRVSLPSCFWVLVPIWYYLTTPPTGGLLPFKKLLCGKVWTREKPNWEEWGP